MFDGAQLLGFVAAVTILVLIPGPNTVLILSNTISGGRKAGLATVLGVETGTLVHTVASALGLSALLAASATAFDTLKYAGAAYLAYLGVRAFLERDQPLLGPSAARMGPARAYRSAVLTNVLNPKVALFFLALLPQFVRPERGNLVLQIFTLGAIVSGVGSVFAILLVLGTSSVGGLMKNAAFIRRLRQVTGFVLLGLGVRLALARRPS